MSSQGETSIDDVTGPLCLLGFFGWRAQRRTFGPHSPRSNVASRLLCVAPHPAVFPLRSGVGQKMASAAKTSACGSFFTRHIPTHPHRGLVLFQTLAPARKNQRPERTLTASLPDHHIPQVSFPIYLFRLPPIPLRRHRCSAPSPAMIVATGVQKPPNSEIGSDLQKTYFMHRKACSAAHGRSTATIFVDRCFESHRIGTEHALSTHQEPSSAKRL